MSSQRLRPHEELPHRVYVLRDRAGAVLYVGSTSQVDKRIKRHLSSQPWRGEVDPAQTHITDEMTWEEALDLEEGLIQRFNPKHNTRKHNGSRYVAGGVRALIATQTKLERAARTGDPDAVAALEAWHEEQRRRALAEMRRTDMAIFSAFLTERAS